MNSLKNNFETVRQGLFKEVFVALEAAFRKLEIEYYVIGAFARDIWILDNSRLPGLRSTLDLDLAIHISGLEPFEELKHFLQNNFNFLPDREPYRLHSPDNLILDLIPFGKIEEDHKVYLAGNPTVELSVLGAKEVAEEAIPVSDAFRIVTIPGLCILKIVSWSQRPEWRGKDLEDFWFLLENYDEIDSELIFSGPFSDLLNEDELSLKVSFARVLGRQMKPVLAKNTELENQIFKALENLKGTLTKEDVFELYKSNPEDSTIRRWRLMWALKDTLQ